MRNRFQAGYALAEVLLATVVVSISVVELSKALSNLNRVAIVASAIAKAGNQADMLMQKIMSERFDENIYNNYSLDLDGTNDHVVANGYKGISGKKKITAGAGVLNCRVAAVPCIHQLILIMRPSDRAPQILSQMNHGTISLLPLRALADQVMCRYTLTESS